MITSLRRRFRRPLWAATALATAALAGTLSLAPASALASGHPHSARPPLPSGARWQRPAQPALLPFSRAATFARGAAASSVFDVCEQGNGLCMRDPFNGGNGTEVVTSSCSGSQTEACDWILFTDLHRCSAFVSATCPGGIISQDYQGFPIIVVSNYGAANGSMNDCIKANAGTGWKGVIGSCDGGPNGTTDEISSAFVYESPCSQSGTFCLISIKYGLDNNAIKWLTSYHNADLDLYVGNDGLYSNWETFSS